MQKPNESTIAADEPFGDDSPIQFERIFYDMMEDIGSFRLWKNSINCVLHPIILKMDRSTFINDLATAVARDSITARSVGSELSREQMIEVFMTSVAFFDAIRERDKEAITDEMATTRQMLFDHLAVATVTNVIGVTVPTVTLSGEVRDA